EYIRPYFVQSINDKARLHFMHLGPKISGVELAFLSVWRRGVKLYSLAYDDLQYKRQTYGRYNVQACSTSGVMSFYEICLAHVRFGWPKVQHRDGLTPRDQWVAYDGVDEGVKKAQYSRRMGLAGVMVWDTTMDDFQGLCGAGRNPLLTAISRTLMGGQGPRLEMNNLTSTPARPLVESSPQTTVTTSSTIITNASPSTAAATHDNIIFPTTPSGLLETSTVSEPEQIPVSINITECKTVGYTPDPQSCFHFYRCDHTRAFRFSCPAGLHWYQDLLLCNWPSLGSCVVSVVSFIRSRFILPEDEDEVIVDEATGALGYFIHFIYGYLE
ncbi:probable chitinase 10, partial [Penaeus indicus]|uniref:probable chitinase 10 n=1 Tax=Penaeus indicus TaxID=29960 RepID=UPI00300C9B03